MSTSFDSLSSVIPPLETDDSSMKVSTEGLGDASHKGEHPEAEDAFAAERMDACGGAEEALLSPPNHDPTTSSLPQVSNCGEQFPTDSPINPHGLCPDPSPPSHALTVACPATVNHPIPSCSPLDSTGVLEGDAVLSSDVERIPIEATMLAKSSLPSDDNVEDDMARLFGEGSPPTDGGGPPLMDGVPLPSPFYMTCPFLGDTRSSVLGSRGLPAPDYDHLHRRLRPPNAL